MPGENQPANTISAAPAVAPQQTPVAPQQPAVPQQTEAAPVAAKPDNTVAPEPPKAADPAPQDVELKLPEGVTIVSRETPVPGTERSLLQSLFGNLGRPSMGGAGTGIGNPASAGGRY